MTDYDRWRDQCPHCKADLRDGSGTRLIHIVDRGRNCVTEYRCPDCKTQWPRSIGEVIALTDPAFLQARSV